MSGFFDKGLHHDALPFRSPFQDLNPKNTLTNV